MSSDEDGPRLKYAFHTRYVLDLGILMQGITRTRDKLSKLKQTISDDPYLAEPAEMRKELDTMYVIPSIEPSRRTIGYWLMAMVRQRVLDAVDALISIQAADNQLFDK